MRKRTLITLTALKPEREIVHAVTTAITLDKSPGSNDVVHADVPAETQVFQGEFAHLPDPRIYREATRSPDKELWIWPTVRS